MPTFCISCSLPGLQSLPLDYGSDLTLRPKASSSKTTITPASTQVRVGETWYFFQHGDSVLTQGLGLGKDFYSVHSGQSCLFTGMLLYSCACKFAFD